MTFCKNCGKELGDDGATLCELCETTDGGIKTDDDGTDKVFDASLSRYALSFRGNSATLFKIWITNLLLTICTLGIYFPWGRVNMKRYIYSSTYVGDYSFEFHGKGKNMFFGLIKFLFITCFSVVVWILIIVLFIPESFIDTIVMELIGWLLVISYMPVLALFIHGARRFRMAKTSYRGIRFGYRGDKVALIKLMFWSIVPFYYPNFKNKFRVYVYGNTRFGNVEAEFTGDEKIYAGIYWRSLILCFVTLGIYYPWYKARLFNYFWKNLSFNKDGNYIRIESKATAAKFFNLKIGNLLILALTLGMGQPIAKVRSLHFLTNNLEMYGNIDLDTVIQTEEQYNSTIGDAADIDDSADFFDMDIF